MKKTITLSLVGAALLATTGVAAAQGGQDARRGPVAEVTRDQALARADQRFARLDVNRDGSVTADEARQARQARRAERQGQMFDRLDANHDGAISREEFGQRQAMRGERRGGRGMMRGMRRGGPRGEARAARMFGGDGVVTREEFRARALQRFERLDTNRDGTITAAERQEARQRLRTERQNRRGGAPRN
ncbi:MAG TPA: EF-hand domain-containing protein [Allosphingosinicella sp.]